MSIISRQFGDKSDYLCKSFAALATGYFDQPSSELKTTAQVPVENLFRLLEMYRNDTFDDEHRMGVTAWNRSRALSIKERRKGEWHNNIKTAITDAIQNTFGSDVSEEKAVTELQDALRYLVVEGRNISPDAANRAKHFFRNLSNAL